jgi:hypothetical protein
MKSPLFVARKGDSMSDKVLGELAEWIDSRVIAEAILQELESQKLEQTVANGQKVWLDFLETELSEGLRSSVKVVF